MEKIFVVNKIVISALVVLCAFACSSSPSVSLGEEGGEYNGHVYSVGSFVFADLDKIYLGKNEGKVYTINGDIDNNFLYENVFSGSDHCYVRDGYKIPDSGKVTAVHSRHCKATDQNTINSFIKMIHTNCEKYQLMTDNLAHDAREFYFAYNNCPVATHKVGYIAYKDEKWLFINMKDSSVANAISNYRFDAPSVTLSATVITDEHFIDILKESDLDLMPASSDKSE